MLKVVRHFPSVARKGERQGGAQGLTAVTFELLAGHNWLLGPLAHAPSPLSPDSSAKKMSRSGSMQKWKTLHPIHSPGQTALMELRVALWVLLFQAESHDPQIRDDPYNYTWFYSGVNLLPLPRAMCAI